MTNQTESMPVDPAIMFNAEALEPAGTPLSAAVSTSALEDDPCGEFVADDCSALALEAERELAAFLITIRNTFGPDATGPAANEWVEVFESTRGRFNGVSAPFRSVTIHAANRVAHGPLPVRHARDVQQ